MIRNSKINRQGADRVPFLPLRLKKPVTLQRTLYGGFLLLISALCAESTPAQGFKFRHDPGNERLEVESGGTPFTTFHYAKDLKKQVLHPILSASGKEITRGYPLAPKPFERSDHLHQVGFWFTFGDVNGLDFWNNSVAVSPENQVSRGRIQFGEFIETDARYGRLATRSHWVDHEDNRLLEEKTSYRFNQEGDLRSIERFTELTAVQEVQFKGNKEGLLGLRVARAFEEPAKEPVRLLNASAEPTHVRMLNNIGVNGVYRNAKGIRGGDVWGTRSAWAALRAEVDGEVITLVLLDHPENPNYPAWWHARGYGLFAINNLGGRGMDEAADPVAITLAPGESLTFRHKLLIGGDLSDEQIARLAKDFHLESCPL